MIFYDIVDLYRSTKGDKKELLQSLVESFIKITISNMFKKDYYKNKYSLSYALESFYTIILNDGTIDLYFEDVRLLDWLKSQCSSFEYNIKNTLNSLSETVRFIYETEDI